MLCKFFSVPNLRFIEFSEIYHINKLGNMVDSCGGGTPSTKNIDFWNGNIPWISSSDIEENNIQKIKITRFITTEAINNSATKLCPPNSIHIVSRVGVGKVAVSSEALCTSQDFFNITKFNGNHLYLAHFIQTKLNNPQSQGTSIKGITSKDLKELEIKIPSISEQNKIASFLSKIDERIQTQNKIINDYKSLKMSIIQQIFNKNYTKVKLKELIKESSNKNKQLSFSDVLSVSNSKGFIKQSEQFEDREIASKDTSNYKIVKKNEYAYNPARINVGSIARLQNFNFGIVSPMYIVFQLDEKQVNFTYFDIYLKSHEFKNQLNKKLEGSVRQCLTFDGMSNIYLNFPSIDIQNNIADKIELIDNKIKFEEKYLACLKIQRTYLLNNMFI